MDMDMPKEVLFISDSATEHNNCSVWNMETGSLINSFKEGHSELKTLSLIRDEYLISAAKGKPFLKLWTLGKTMREECRFIMPGIVSALTVTPCGIYCAGAIENKFHVWKVTTGECLAVVSNHYQDITCLKFSDDGCYLVSGGKDAIVFVWTLSTLLNHLDQQDNIRPTHTWNHHSAEVTDLFIGNLCSDRVATVSKDQTCKIYDISSGQLLCSICMDVELSSVTMDPAEYFLMLGAINGNIYKINMFSSGERILHYNEMEEKAIFKGHSEKVTCLSVSMEGTHLLSGSEDKFCKLWKISSMTCIRSIPFTGAITNAFIAVAPFSLLAAGKILPKLPVSTFSRSFNTKSDIFSNQLNKTEPVHLQGCQLTTCPLDNTNDDFIRDVSRGMKEPGSVSKEVLMNSLEQCDIINQQMYSYAFTQLLETLHNSQKK